MEINRVTEKNFLINVFVFILACVALYICAQNYLFFSFMLSLSPCIIGFIIFFIAMYTYNYVENYFFLTLGIGFGFISLFNLFDLLYYNNYINIDLANALNISSQYWISENFLVSLSFLISCLIAYKNIKKINSISLFLFFIIASAILVSSISFLHIFPECCNNSSAYTPFRTICSCLFIGINLISAYILYLKRNTLNAQLFFCTEFSIMLSILIVGINTILSSSIIIVNISTSILKLLSFYCIYKGIYDAGYKLYINETNDKLEIKTSQLKKQNLQKKYFEDAFIKNDKCYKLLVENSEEAIVIISKNHIIFANNKATELIGFAFPNELIGCNILDFIPQKEKIRIENIKKRLDLDSSFPFSFETQLLNINNSVIDIKISTTSFIFEGNPALMCIVQDLSYKKQVETLQKSIEENIKLLNESKELNKAITESFASISHELKTPLNVMLGALQLIDIYNKEPDSQYSQKTVKYLKTIRQNCYRLLRLINNIVDISKIDAGFMQLHLQNMNIVELVEDITMSVVDLCKNKGINLTFDTNTEEQVIACDPDKIERIILNLLSNAIKFTNPGDEIFVSLTAEDSKVLISVKDTGIGIPQSNLNTIFERYKQVDEALSKNQFGSGIGLSLVKSLVELHEGSISLKSKQGEGSEFIITLPIRIADIKAEDVCVHYESNVERRTIEFVDIYS